MRVYFPWANWPRVQGRPPCFNRGTIEVFADGESTAALTRHIAGRRGLQDSRSIDAHNLLRSWVEDCNANHHTTCRLEADIDKPPALPTRVIDVDPRGPDKIPCLIETRAGETGEYVALSHCWGPKENHPPSTTTASLSDHLKQSPMATLSKTFTEAIEVIRELGVRYLWIDSLCIVQDDEDDWEREAKTMASVYGSSYLTIAATHARSCQDGLFLDHDTLEGDKIIELPYLRQDGSRDGVFYLRLRSREALIAMRPDLGPLGQRAWCLQEYLLPKWVISYTKLGLWWECHKRNHCETLASTMPDRSYEWADIVRKYSRRQLTRITDRQVAIQGMIDSVARRRPGQRCFYGIWQDSPFDLLWSAAETWKFEHPSLSDRSSELKIPTWSWMSQVGDVSFLDIGPLALALGNPEVPLISNMDFATCNIRETVILDILETQIEPFHVVSPLALADEATPEGLVAAFFVLAQSPGTIFRYLASKRIYMKKLFWQLWQLLTPPRHLLFGLPGFGVHLLVHRGSDFGNDLHCVQSVQTVPEDFKVTEKLNELVGFLSFDRMPTPGEEYCCVPLVTALGQSPTGVQVVYALILSKFSPSGEADLISYRRVGMAVIFSDTWFRSEDRVTIPVV